MIEVNHITVARQPSTATCTLSRFLFDGKEKGVGVEDVKRDEKIHGQTCIPDGTYNLALTPSPKFSEEYYRDDEGNIILKSDRKTPELMHRYNKPHELITVMNVPKYSRILWHWGNDDRDTDGCYLVGSVFGNAKGRMGVLNSRKKYMEVYPIIWRSIRAAEAAAKHVTVQYMSV